MTAVIKTAADAVATTRTGAARRRFVLLYYGVQIRNVAGIAKW